MELQPLKIRFYPKQKRGNIERYSLYMRMVLFGKRAEISLNYELPHELWNHHEQTLKGNNTDRGYVMNLTNQYRLRALGIYQEYIQRGIACDVNLIRERLTGSENDSNTLNPTLFILFDRIISRKKTLAGQNNSKATIQKYNRCKAHLKKFIQQLYKTEDVKFSQVNLQFLEDFELYLKTTGKCCHNSTMKHIQTFKTIYKSASAHGYADKDPFQKYKIRMEEVVRDFLSEKEIQQMIDLDLPPNKLANVRDLFIFCCYTGLAYIDLKNLTIKNITFENGRFWVKTRRQKTNVKSNIPLLEIPLQLINKYCPDFENGETDKMIFRVISNQKVNNYLKEIAVICGIKKVLTFHIARHTFATTITLNNGVPIESVSSMLGHRLISTTQHYAKLLDKKLEEDMDNLSQRLDKNKLKFGTNKNINLPAN